LFLSNNSIKYNTMKKIIITIFILFTISSSYAQFDTIYVETNYNDTCRLWKNVEVKKRYKLELDTSWRDIDLTTLTKDDTTRYLQKKTDDTLRLVYFLHGLGGNRGSWSAVHDAHISDYKYFPYRLDYSEGWEAGGSNQRDFQLASEVTQQDMDEGRTKFLQRVGSVGSEVGLPYVIGHSQGGLVARDLDMKYATGIYPLLDSTDRRFWGMVTVGTPNAGALIAVNHDAMDAFAADLLYKLAAPQTLNLLNNINLKIPFYSKRFNGLYTTANNLVSDVSNFLGNDLLAMVTKAKRDPITRQYGPNSSYLLDTLNHSTPHIAKAAFYGIEQDPVLWRIATYMIGKETSEYSTFGANDDDAMGENMKDLRLKYIAEAYSTSIQIKNHKSRIAKCKWWKPWKCVGRKNLEKEVERFEEEEEAWNEGADFLFKADVIYKVNLGAVDPSNMYRQDTVAWMCTKIVREVVNRGGPPVTRIVKKRVASPNDCDGHYVSPIVEDVLIEIPTDATVTVPSQKALPGCISDYVHEMNEVLDHQKPDWNKVIIRSGVNHMQERNSDQTDAMLRRIYEGRDTPLFFRLYRQ
jgi:triacylglycerol esterase/lipase EstA (alpha/beta hydrolase family)